MFSTGLHTVRRNGPNCLLQVELLPACPQHLTRPCSGQDREFKGKRRRRLSRPQIGNEGWQLRIVHSRVMPATEHLALGEELIQMTTPPGWVFPRAEPLGLGGVKHSFNPTTKARGGFGFLIPKRLENRKHVLCSNRVHW